VKPTLLFYGNCQAAALRVIFSADPVVTEHFRVVYVPSFDDRIPDAERADAEAIRATTIFFDQHDRAPFPQADLLSDDCARITFPSIDLNLLWPLHCVNMFNDAPTPDRLWGSFPYGDRVIVQSVESGLSAEATIGGYAAASASQLPNLDRFEKLEHARLLARDAKCDVKFADYVLGSFRQKNLFWCVNHPTMTALAELSHRLIDAAKDRSAALAGAPIDATIASLHPEGPLNFIRVPVHPAIADTFRLEWYPRDGGAHYGLRDERRSYDDYFADMAACSVRVRDAKRAIGVGTGHVAVSE
jgi:hypothetical protein